jgi:hypothetical protein
LCVLRRRRPSARPSCWLALLPCRLGPGWLICSMAAGDEFHYFSNHKRKKHGTLIVIVSA